MQIKFQRLTEAICLEISWTLIGTKITVAVVNFSRCQFAQHNTLARPLV
jgi:hypothetical protein